MFKKKTLVSGCIKNWKAKLQNRRGPRIWQPYLDLTKFLVKDMVISEHASWIFRFMPYVLFVSTMLAGLMVPLITATAPLSLFGGVLALFFFSGRRRHTILTCDWSSDVCSSDLASRHRVERRFRPRSTRGSPSSGCRPGSNPSLVLSPRPVRIRPVQKFNCEHTMWRQTSNRSEERRVGKESRSRGWRHT